MDASHFFNRLDSSEAEKFHARFSRLSTTVAWSRPIVEIPRSLYHRKIVGDSSERFPNIESRERPVNTSTRYIKRTDVR